MIKRIGGLIGLSLLSLTSYSYFCFKRYVKTQNSLNKLTKKPEIHLTFCKYIFQNKKRVQFDN